mgnify:CR=1 FL=1
MGQRLPKGEVIMTGLGGSGILTAGLVLASAAVSKYKNVTWFPSYAISKRGGPVECTIIYSNEEISSPLLSRAEVVIIAESTQFKDFEGRVRPGGMMIIESAGFQAESKKEDFRIIKVPAIETIVHTTGSSLGANLALLGAFVAATGSIPAELIHSELEKSFASKEEVLKKSLRAFEEGRNMVAALI